MIETYRNGDRSATIENTGEGSSPWRVTFTYPKLPLHREPHRVTRHYRAEDYAQMIARKFVNGEIRHP